MLQVYYKLFGLSLPQLKLVRLFLYLHGTVFVAYVARMAVQCVVTVACFKISFRAIASSI
jgi:hypothetical protein